MVAGSYIASAISHTCVLFLEGRQISSLIVINKTGKQLQAKFASTFPWMMGNYVICELLIIRVMASPHRNLWTTTAYLSWPVCLTQNMYVKVQPCMIWWLRCLMYYIYIWHRSHHIIHGCIFIAVGLITCDTVASVLVSIHHACNCRHNWAIVRCRNHRIMSFCISLCQFQAVWYAQNGTWFVLKEYN